MSYTAEYPDGTSELLLSVPKYDFNWQFKYQLQEPLFMPSGTKLVAEGRWITRIATRAIRIQPDLCSSVYRPCTKCLGSRRCVMKATCSRERVAVNEETSAGSEGAGGGE